MRRYVFENREVGPKAYLKKMAEKKKARSKLVTTLSAIERKKQLAELEEWLGKEKASSEQVRILNTIKAEKLRYLTQKEEQFITAEENRLRRLIQISAEDKSVFTVEKIEQMVSDLTSPLKIRPEK